MSPQIANHRRRYLSLAVFAGLWVVGSSWPVLGAVAVAGLLGLTAVRLRRRIAAARSARRRAGSGRGAHEHGIALGAEPSGRAVHVTDRQLGAHALIVGASGSGKSTTLIAVLADQIGRGCPVVAIDMKGSPAFAGQLRMAAHAAGRELRIWSPDGPGHWNPLAHGNATALKDKLISTERFSEPHYQRAAERYLQTALQVLQAAHPDRPVALEEVVAAMEPRRLAKSLRAVPQSLADRVQDYLLGLTPDQLSAARGLGTRLAILSESSAGGYLAGGPPTSRIDLGAALEGGDVVLFSLNSSVYGKLAAQLGALAIQDLVSAAGRRLETLGDTPGDRPGGLRGAPGRSPALGDTPGDRPGGLRGAAGRSPAPATVAIDEFSALGADNVLALLAR
ncbi:MAG: FtsK/SpoIIIE domain-containing protein, partial [Solirubrobacteraceae bacterium]